MLFNNKIKELNNKNYDYFEFETNNINNKYKLNYYSIEDASFKVGLENSLKESLIKELSLLKPYIDLISLHEISDKEDNKAFDEIDFFIKSRKHRANIKHSFHLRKFLIGDVLEFVYNYKSLALTFSGICIALKKKGFVMPDLSLILRNVIMGIGLELTISYFYNRGFRMQFLDYRRKFFSYNKNKLYFIRYRVNKESKI
jgi:ribosomal protein L19